MFSAHRMFGGRLTCIACTLTAVLVIAAVGGVPGCSSCKTCKPLFSTCPSPVRNECTPCPEHGYCNSCKTQVQFYAPPGAVVTIRSPERSHEVATYGPFNNRLEQNPEEFAVFNLYPGRYEFKYTTAEGLPGASIYGELEVKHANTSKAQVFQRLAFVPIALPSEYYRQVDVTGDEIFPYRSEAMRTAIDAMDLDRLAAGDVVEKVFVVADLEDADKRLKATQIKIAETEREIEYADAKFRYAYLDFRMEAGDDNCPLFSKDRKFIAWEKRRQELQQELDELNARLKRTQSLLRGDHVLIRKGMMVVATEEIVKPHRDVVEASDRLGEIMLVMRVGGRHRHWGDPAQAQVTNLP